MVYAVTAFQEMDLVVEVLQAEFYENGLLGLYFYCAYCVLAWDLDLALVLLFAVNEIFCVVFYFIFFEYFVGEGQIVDFSFTWQII